VVECLRVFGHVGFFCFAGTGADRSRPAKKHQTEKVHLTMVYQIEQVEGFRSMNQSHTVLSPVFNISPLSGSHRSIDDRDTKSRTRFETSELLALGSREEALIVDERSKLRPAQVIEGKLRRLLRNSSLPVNFLLTRRVLRTR